MDDTHWHTDYVDGHKENILRSCPLQLSTEYDIIAQTGMSFMVGED